MVKLQQLYFYTWVGKTVQARNTIVEYIHADSSSAGCWEAKLTTQNGCDTWGIKQTVFAGYMYVYVYTHTYIYMYVCMYVSKYVCMYGT